VFKSKRKAKENREHVSLAREKSRQGKKNLVNAQMKSHSQPRGKKYSEEKKGGSMKPGGGAG